MSKKLLGILAISWAANCVSGGTGDTLRSLKTTVKKVLGQFGSHSFPVEYSFEEKQLIHPGNLEMAGWNSNARKLWVYSHELGPACQRMENIAWEDRGFRGFITGSKEYGDTTVVSGWDVSWGKNISFFGRSFGIAKSGDTAWGSSGGDAVTGGSLSRITRHALYYNGIDALPEAEKGDWDTVIYEDSLGNRLACTRITSIAITLSNGYDYFSKVAPGKSRQTRKIPCATLPLKCPLDTGDLILRDINKKIGDFAFSIKDDDGICNEAVFRIHADCKRYQRRCPEEN